MGRRPRIARLVRKEEFLRAYREGIRRSNALLVVHAVPNGLREVRVGIAAGRGIGRAVVRNRVRRRLWEAVRAHGARMAGGIDLVLVPRASAAAVAFAELVAAAADGLGAVGAFVDASGGSSPR
jgi:ribonuclease P protein component